MKHEIPLMLKQGGGAIVNTSSGAGVKGFAGQAAYCAAKYGIVGLSRAAALDYAKANIRVNVVCPGIIETPMMDRFSGGTPEGRGRVIAQEPVGRMGKLGREAFYLMELSQPRLASLGPLPPARHVWVTPDLAGALSRHVIHKDARDWPQTSDHVPVCVELSLWGSNDPLRASRLPEHYPHHPRACPEDPRLCRPHGSRGWPAGACPRAGLARPVGGP